MRTITSIEGNTQKLDGGAMFGNAPKALWTRWTDVDSLNRIPLACRAMLIQEEHRNILFETGIGAFFEPKLRERFGVQESEHVLLQSLDAVGLSHEDIDAVVLSHLHFDHAGGLLSAYVEGQEPELLFPHATYVVGSEAWERANAPHPRDRASFIPRLNRLLSESGRLEVVRGDTSEILGGDVRFHRSHGHTPGLLLAEVASTDGPIVFGGDLIPGAAWIHLPITMGYDRFPELLIEEKTTLLHDLLDRNGRLFLTHDPKVALCGIAQDEKGRFMAKAPLATLTQEDLP